MPGKAGKHPVGIHSGLLGDFSSAFTAQFSQAIQDLRKIFRRIVLTVVTPWREIRSIGFQYQEFQRQGCCYPANFQGPVVGDGTAYSDDETELDKMLGLLITAAESVNYSTVLKTLAPQRCQNLIMGFSHMQQEWQTLCPCNIYLRLKEFLLSPAIQPLHEVIETYFTDGYTAWLPCQNSQLVKITLLMVGKIHGVQSRGSVQLRIRCSQPEHAGPASPDDARHNEIDYAGFTGTLNYLLIVGKMSIDIEMTMGIDKLHTTFPFLRYNVNNVLFIRYFLKYPSSCCS